MPKWIHDRADHIRAKNPDMPKGMEFALATQQAHKLGKTPKGYGTAEGKSEARAKFQKPKKEYKKTATFKPPTAGLSPVQRLKKAQSVGLQKSFDQKKDGIGLQKFKPMSMSKAQGSVKPSDSVKIKMSTVLAKTAFQTSEYSGPLSEGRFNYRSYGGMPSRPGGIKVSGPPSQKGEQENPETAPAPETREKQASLWKAAHFAIDAIGSWENNIQEQAGFSKEAVLREAIRLGLKDVPNTPRLLMKKRNWAQRAHVADKIGDAYDAKITNPLMNVANSAVIRRMPEGKAKKLVEAGAEMMARDPVGHGIMKFVPLPGASIAYEAGKRSVAKAINKADPMPLL